MRIWELNAPPVVRTLIHHDASVVDVDIDKKGRRLITAGRDKAAIICDIETGNVISELPHDAPLVSARFIDQNTAICRTEKDLVWWDINRQSVVHKLSASGLYRVNTFGQVKHGKVIVDESRSEVFWGLPDSAGIVSIQRRDAATGDLRSSWIAHGIKETIVDLDLSPDATRLATCAAYDAETFRFGICEPKNGCGTSMAITGP